ncbi:hypothetical protein LAT59_02575 [Candidatus Gracilibacteria bacterium]|nr:hypothetical protein [Candidatus Gracilibacteria bacterium]
MKTTIDLEALQKAGLSFEEIESVKRGLADIEAGRVYSEEEFYMNLEKRLFDKKESYV